ncbi:hypothetical protein KEM54_000169, partial [Ascosphaera aggregata]
MAEGTGSYQSSVPSSQPVDYGEGVDDNVSGSQATGDDGLELQAVPGLDDYSESSDYYALLNLARNPPPSDAQIRAAFRTLTLSFHPDKQPPELRDAAAQHYDKLRIAYETLSDPRRRVVYDMLGEEGVREEWG